MCDFVELSDGVEAVESGDIYICMLHDERKGENRITGKKGRGTQRKTENIYSFSLISLSARISSTSWESVDPPAGAIWFIKFPCGP